MRRFLAAVLVGLLGLGPLPAAAQTIQSAVPSTVSATRSATPVSSPRRASGYAPSLIGLDVARGYFQDGKGNVAAGSPASLSGWSFTGGPSTAPDATGNLSLYREAITNWAFPSTIPGTVPGGNDKWNNNFNGGTSVFVANDRAAPNGTITATKVTTPTTGYDGPYFRSTHIPAANENWTIQAWVYSAAGANFQLNALGSGGTSFTSTASQTFTVPAATWTLLSMQRTGVASPTASSVTAAVLVNGPDTFWVGPVFFGPSNTINVPDVPTTSAAVTRPADVPITNLGLQVWEGRQNLVKNSTMQGSNGSNLPTGWTFQPGAGLTQSIVGKGVEYGLDYIDWSITGTASGTVFPAIYVTGTNASGIAVTNGQPVSASFYYRLVAGALPGGSMAAGTVLFDSGGTYLGGLSTGTSAGTAFGRLTTSATIANASAAYTAFYVAPATPAGITNGTVVNAVIRIYAPQVELATTPGPYLPTTSGAVTKAADAAAITASIFTAAAPPSLRSLWREEPISNSGPIAALSPEPR